MQDGGYGSPSDMESFYVNVDGICPVPGTIPATARKNNFCRIGTFPEHHEAVWTFTEGEHALAVARNPFTTYLKLIVLDQETKQPFEKVITCWSLLSNFEPGWQPPFPPEGKFNFEDLPVEEPPPTPTPKPIACHEKLGQEDCKAAGGTYFTQNQYCQCP